MTSDKTRQFCVELTQSVLESRSGERKRRFEGMHSRTRVSPSSFVYFVQAETGKVKIGYSQDPIDRLTSMRIGSPVKIWLVGAFEVRQHSVHALEKVLHRAFRAYHSHGEWYDIPHDLLVVFLAYADAATEEEDRTQTAVILGRLALELNGINESTY